MKIAINISTIQDQYAFRGIGRYTKEITKRFILKKQDLNLDLHLIGFGNLAENLEILELKNDSNINFHSLGPLKNSSPLNNILLYFTKYRPIIAEIQPEIYFDTYFERILPNQNIKESYVVVHDAIPLLNNSFSSKGSIQNFIKGLYYRFAWERQKNCTKIIAISNYSAETASQFGLARDKMEVIYNGVSEIFLNYQPNDANEQQILKKFDISNPYLIYDSGLETNKNTKSLIELMIEITKLNPQLKLLITGGSIVNGVGQNIVGTNFVNQLKKFNLESAVYTPGRVSEQELLALFHKAKGYLNFSNAEGFGFGPLQAMAIGIPAFLNAKNQVFNEVAAPGGAIMVDLDDVLATAQTVNETINNVETTTKLKMEGQPYARQFTWERTFNQIIDMMELP